MLLHCIRILRNKTNVQNIEQYKLLYLKIIRYTYISIRCKIEMDGKNSRVTRRHGCVCTAENVIYEIEFNARSVIKLDEFQ